MILLPTLRILCPLLFFLLHCNGAHSSSSLGATDSLVAESYKRELLQNVVTWDESSIFVHGERIMLFSGEFHPYRLPVPSLWLDILQKIKAAGYNCVSFYVDWALLEGKQGSFRADGAFAWEPLFEAATKAGVYLIARPGPYINAEVSGGGFPGWLQRLNGTLRTSDPEYLRATDLYVRKIGEIVAEAQITNGGPVILLQPENEYTMGTEDTIFPDRDYFEYVIQQYRDAGVIVPVVNNEAYAAGVLTPGSGKGAPDIYAHDGYPIGFDCANPTVWVDDAIPTDWGTLHKEQSPTTPYSILEFQGGAYDPWGGAGFDQCAALTNHEFARVLYKNNYSFGATIFNIYMTFGGTNWGNLGHAGGYTSYDYGALIAEERLVTREKYSEVKLQANLLHSAPAYLDADRGINSTTLTTNPAITATVANSNDTRLYFVRHTEYQSLDSTEYALHVQSSKFGNITVPQLNKNLSLHGRDSKIHVSDYPVGDSSIVYSSAEIFTWQQYPENTVLIVYGGPDEYHELALEMDELSSGDYAVLEGSGVEVTRRHGYVILSWNTSPERQILDIAKLKLRVYLLDRNSVYNYWVLGAPSTFASPSVVIKAGYLMRHAEIQERTLSLTGDINVTTTIEVIGGGPSELSKLTFNGAEIPFTADSKTGIVKAVAEFEEPHIELPDLRRLNWKSIDSLPEIQDTYDDSAWTSASLQQSYNTHRAITTPTSLYGSDYGYHSGALLFRGLFTATGSEKTFSLQLQGGSAFGFSTWIRSHFLGSWTGSAAAVNGSSTFDLPKLIKGEEYVITVILDNMGYDGNWWVGGDEMKAPRGILNYDLDGHEPDDVVWKLTGNLGGEDYVDLTRGPLNEGGLFAERQGYHLPAPPVKKWEDSHAGPSTGIKTAGVTFYSTEFELDLPRGYDIPLAFVFGNTTDVTTAYRVQLFVNGWQFGKYVHNIGPQARFPVPEGILDYHGTNWVGLTLWALESEGARVESLELEPVAVVQSGFGEVKNSWGDKWRKRKGAY